MCCRHFRHVKRRRKANKALRRLRTIAGILLRELARKLPQEVLSLYQAQFDLHRRVLSQKKKDKNKIYSLHEPDVYCVGKGKDHKPYECEVLLPGPPLKRGTTKERNRKRVLCRQRAAIEPLIGHLKHDYRLSGIG